VNLDALADVVTTGAAVVAALAAVVAALAAVVSVPVVVGALWYARSSARASAASAEATRMSAVVAQADAEATRVSALAAEASAEATRVSALAAEASAAAAHQSLELTRRADARASERPVVQWQLFRSPKAYSYVLANIGPDEADQVRAFFRARFLRHPWPENLWQGSMAQAPVLLRREGWTAR
jgi:hypothetical protein